MTRSPSSVSSSPPGRPRSATSTYARWTASRSLSTSHPGRGDGPKRPSPRTAGAIHIRLISAAEPGWNFSAPHPTGSPWSVATNSSPDGGVSSLSSAEMLRVHDVHRQQPPEFRRPSSLGNCFGMETLLPSEGSPHHTRRDSRDNRKLSATPSQYELTTHLGKSRLESAVCGSEAWQCRLGSRGELESAILAKSQAPGDG